MASIARSAADFISRNPALEECLASNLINYSKLARLISSEIRTSRFNAVLAACRRYASAIRDKNKKSGFSALKSAKKTIKIENKNAYITFSISEKILPEVLEAVGKN